MKKKILIIEDEDIAELERDYLEVEGFDVTVESDGIQGEKLAMSGEYDLLILDLMLPGTDGFSICRKFREKFLTPVIIVSAKEKNTDKLYGVKLGADDYITKPFETIDLVTRVKERLKRYETLIDGRKYEHDVIVSGDLRIDKTAQCVFLQDKEINLTPKQYALLCYLADHPGIYISRKELLQNVWGYSDESMPKNTSTINVHIREIRNQLNDNPADPIYIETKNNLGYRFNLMRAEEK